MPMKELTVSDAIRFANHDYLNHLQLLKMNLELGQLDAVKDLIEQYTVNVRMFSQLQTLNSPKLLHFLQTCKWRYPAFTLQLMSHVTEQLQLAYDEPLVEYLEKTVLHYAQHAKVTDQLELTIDIVVTQQVKQLFVCVEGMSSIKPFTLHETENIHVDIEEASHECLSYRLTWQ